MVPALRHLPAARVPPERQVAGASAPLVPALPNLTTQREHTASRLTPCACWQRTQTLDGPTGDRLEERGTSSRWLSNATGHSLADPPLQTSPNSLPVSLSCVPASLWICRTPSRAEHAPDRCEYAIRASDAPLRRGQCLWQQHGRASEKRRARTATYLIAAGVTRRPSHAAALSPAVPKSRLQPDPLPSRPAFSTIGAIASWTMSVQGRRWNRARTTPGPLTTVNRMHATHVAWPLSAVPTPTKRPVTRRGRNHLTGDAP